ncbi:MAG: DMT family transporter [Nocardioidaceae bacterium]|nr:DMT family transporter [Nocardioidaceae bacterium]MCL2613877.1 DMT family transporter [Nocardioidaceae bacterium]
MTSKPSVLPLVAVSITLVLWASAFVGIRHLGGTVEPGALSLARLTIMVVALGLLVARNRRLQVPTRGEWPLIVAGGLGWFSIYNLALNASEQRIDAGTAALIVQVGPIVVALLATTLLGERLTRWTIVGTLVGFAGVAVIAQSSGTSAGDLVGVGLALVAALGFAVGVLTQKRLLTRLRALDLTFWFTVVGAIGCLPWAGQLAHTTGSASAGDLAWIVYLGIFPSAVGFVLWAYALSHADAGRFAQSTFLVPFLTALMAWALLDEVPPALAFVGGAMCIGGVLVSRRTPPRATTPLVDGEADVEKSAAAPS